jgi:hypothetical protein
LYHSFVNNEYRNKLTGATLSVWTKLLPSLFTIFELSGSQTAVQKLTFHQARPVSQLTNDSPIEFNISGQNGMDYIDLKKQYDVLEALMSQNILLLLYGRF